MLTFLSLFICRTGSENTETIRIIFSLWESYNAQAHARVALAIFCPVTGSSFAERVVSKKNITFRHITLAKSLRA